MVVLDQFYQITEANTLKVSVFWKVAHVFFFIGAAICGFLTAFTFGQVLEDFNYNCVLNADVVFSDVNILFNTTNKSIYEIDLTQSYWGTPSSCYFAQFTPLFAMISAVVWGTFFVILGRGGGGYSSDLLSQPWAVVYPCTFFTAVTIITSLISLIRLKDGILKFCKEFHSQFGNDKCVENIDMYTSQFHEVIDLEGKPFLNFYMNQELAILSAKIALCLWIAQLCLLIARVFFVVDFNLQLVTIIPKEEEVIEKIIEPEFDEDEGDDDDQV